MYCILCSTSLLFKLIHITMPQLMLILSSKQFNSAPYEYYNVYDVMDIYHAYLCDKAQYDAYLAEYQYDAFEHLID